jgi:hypothetical protein
VAPADLPALILGGVRVDEDIFVCERGRDEHPAALPADVAVAVHPGPGVRVIGEPLQRPRVGMRRGGIGALGRLEPERLMRTLVVVLAPEPVERALLGADVVFWVLDELGQRAVEALLTAVLLRFPGRDAVVPDP